jgi:hypothetical protein
LLLIYHFIIVFYFQLRSITDTCYGVSIGALAILHALVLAPAPVADPNPTTAPNLGAAASAPVAAAPTAIGTSAGSARDGTQRGKTVRGNCGLRVVLRPGRMRLQ